jgi:8-oxo-dGTP pyrophosphatase MutT (NUDIX family)
VRFDNAVSRLQTALGRPLPGESAQALMAPRPRRDWPTGFDMAGLRHAAGLLLVFPHDDRAHVALTVRAQTLDRHGGQVSLPGGAVEPGETIEEAALRESHEEIGLSAADVRLLGALTPVDVAVSGFRLHPLVGITAVRPCFHPAVGEVDRVLEVPVRDLLAADGLVWRSLTREGRVLDFPAFAREGAEIWGATAMVLAEFLTLLGWSGPPVSQQG